MGKTILISGGAGFVGRHLLTAILQAEPSAAVWIIDDFSTGKPPEQWELHRAIPGKDPGSGRQYRLDTVADTPFTLVKANFAYVLGAELGYFPASGLPSLPAFG